MNPELKFTVQTMFSKEKDGRVTGPMSPVLFAKEMAEQLGIRYNRLARLWFSDNNIFQRTEDGGLTGYDCLIIADEQPGSLWLSLWVDLGVGGLPVAMQFDTDAAFDVSPIYSSEEFNRKLSHAEIETVFKHLFAHPELLAVKEK